MEKTLFIVLKPGAELTEEDGCVGIQRDGKSRFAQNEGQAAALRALARQPQTLAAVSALLRVRDGPEKEEWEIALLMAAFILDFGDYLDSGGTDLPPALSR